MSIMKGSKMSTPLTLHVFNLLNEIQCIRYLLISHEEFEISRLFSGPPIINLLLKLYHPDPTPDSKT